MLRRLLALSVNLILITAIAFAQGNDTVYLLQPDRVFDGHLAH